MNAFTAFKKRKGRNMNVKFSIKKFLLVLMFLCALLAVACKHTHEFGEWVVVKEATEVEEGLKERTCECGEKESQKIDKLAHTHNFGEWVVVKEATEQEEGLRENTCECGEKESEEIAKLEHVHNYVDGKCSCGAEEEHVHAFGEWVVVKDATEEEAGLKERTCECGEKQTEEIAKLEHVHKFENGSCACGEAHDCVYVDGKCECGKVEEIVYDYSKLLVGAGLEADTEVEGVKYYFGETAFATVNEALAKAAEGATIYVLAGEYPITEAIEINKPITLVGPNANKGANDERVAEAMFTSDNYETGSIFVGGANITLNGLGFKGVGEQGYPIQSREELENFAIKSCYFENVNTVFCPYASTNFKGTFTIADTVNNNNLQFLAWVAGSAAELTKFEFTNNKVYGEVATHFAAKGMISFRATDSNAEVVIEGNEFDLEDYALASNPIYVASGKLSVKNNKFTGVAEAGLFYEGTVEAALEGNEFAALPTPVTISSIIAAEDGEFEVEAVVVAVNAQSFLIKDETGAMLVYKGKEWVQDVVVGDKVKVAGLTSVYGNAKQFGQDATYEKLETVEVVYEEAKALTAADVDAIQGMLAGTDYNAAADVDKDGEITVADFEYLAKYIVGAIDYAKLCALGAN